MRRICFQYKHFFKDKVNTTNAKIKTYQSASFFMTVFFYRDFHWTFGLFSNVEWSPNKRIYFEIYIQLSSLVYAVAFCVSACFANRFLWQLLMTSELRSFACTFRSTLFGAVKKCVSTKVLVFQFRRIVSAFTVFACRCSPFCCHYCHSAPFSVTESNDTGGKVGKAGIAGKLGQTDKTCLQLETPVGSWE